MSCTPSARFHEQCSERSSGREFCTSQCSHSICNKAVSSGTRNLKRILAVLSPLLLGLIVLATSGCSNTEAKKPAPQTLPVNTKTIDLAEVPQTDEYVATVKSRRSATIQPQVDGSLTHILVKSGDHVHAGQVLMTIDPLKQQATVDQQVSTEAQKKAVFDYAQRDLERQQHLFDAGVISKQSYEQAVQAFDNAKADWDSSKAARITQQRQLAYYNLVAPFAGVIGDIPVHIGDYVSPQTVLTTVDENADLEAYIYIPTERSGNIRIGLPVQIVTTTGEVIENTQINFVSQQVDNAVQGVLAKAPIHVSLDRFRTEQLVKARVVWSTSPTPTVPVLAVTRIGGQPFVYVATEANGVTVAKQRSVTLGDTIGNDYAVKGGLKPGEKVIVSGTQFLIDGTPVRPIS